MNKFQGIVSSIKTEGSLSLIEILVGEVSFTGVIIDDLKSENSLKQGKSLEILFKETEVIISNGPVSGISLRNQIQGEIQNIEKGNILSKISIKCSIGNINSIITSGSVDRLNLKISDSVTAMIKTNEIFLKYD